MKKIHDCLNAFGHLLWIFVRIVSFKQRIEVDFRIGHLEALDVELMLEEDFNIINFQR